MKNNILSKILLFISSNCPLYIFIIIKNTNWNWKSWSIEKIYPTNIENLRKWFFNSVNFEIMILLSLIILSILPLFWLKKFNGSKIRILDKKVKVTPISDISMNYLITYIIPLITLKLTETSTVITNVLILVILGWLYVVNSVVYINPLFSFLGYKVYTIENLSDTFCVISKLTFNELNSKIKLKDEFDIYNLCEGIKVIKKVKE